LLLLAVLVLLLLLLEVEGEPVAEGLVCVAGCTEPAESVSRFDSRGGICGSDLIEALSCG
jgi:hypothetical protein